MSGALPNTDFQVFNIKSNQPTLVSISDSGKSFRRQVSGQRWSMTLSYPIMTRSIFAPTMAFIVKQRGAKESFTITYPSYMNAQGNETGTVLVNGVHAVGDTTIAMDGFGGDGAGRFLAGDFIKFSGHDKVYMVVADVTSSSNASTVTIEPPIVSALANNETVTYDSVPFTVYLLNDVQEFNAGQANSSGLPLFKFELDVIEAI